MRRKYQSFDEIEKGMTQIINDIIAYHEYMNYTPPSYEKYDINYSLKSNTFIDSLEWCVDDSVERYMNNPNGKLYIFVAGANSPRKLFSQDCLSDSGSSSRGPTARSIRAISCSSCLAFLSVSMLLTCCEGPGLHRCTAILMLRRIPREMPCGPGPAGIAGLHRWFGGAMRSPWS